MVEFSYTFIHKKGIKEMNSLFNTANERIAYYKLINMKPNFSKLSKETGVNRHTLSDMYYERREFNPRERKSELDPIKEEIRDILKDATQNISAAYFYFTDEERGEKKITCSLSNFTKYVKKHNLNVKEVGYVAHFRYETDPGDQLQVDWVEDLKICTCEGELIKYNLFSATLGYSRMHYFEFTKTKTEEDFMRCLLHAFQYFGGKTKNVLTDNMAAIVNVNEKGDKKIHETVKQFFKDLDVELQLCKVRTPQTKGKCETSNKFAKWLSAYNNKLKDELQLFQKIYRLNETINKTTINQFLGRPPIILFEKEKELLRELSDITAEQMYTTYAKTVKVPSTGLINYKGKLYGVGIKFVGKRVKIEASNDTILIFYNSLLIVSHKINDQKVNYTAEQLNEFYKSKGFKDDEIEKFSHQQLERYKNIDEQLQQTKK